MGGKSRKVREQAFRRTVRGRLLREGCPECGGKGPHLVPASAGDPALWMCTGRWVSGDVILDDLLELPGMADAVEAGLQANREWED